MSLFSLARRALERIFTRRSLVRAAPITRLNPLVKAEPVQRTPPPPPEDGRGKLGPPRVIATPIRPGPTPQELADIKEVQDVYDEIQLTGRDQGYDAGGIDAVMAKMRQVSSSNVWGYYFEVEGGYSQSVGKYRGAKSGLLYVTFLAEAPPGGQRPSTAGPTYVYLDVPFTKYQQFEKATEASAGRAVWDYLRVRGTSWKHQHRYRLAQVQGEYIPRKASRLGFVDRNLINPEQKSVPNSTWQALSRLASSKSSNSDEIKKYANQMKQLLLQQVNIRRSTLPARRYIPKTGAPNRGKPNRGTPNRGN
jgi:hypothetical protein